jgi:hypothetical protein
MIYIVTDKGGKSPEKHNLTLSITVVSPTFIAKIPLSILLCTSDHNYYLTQGQYNVNVTIDVSISFRKLTCIFWHSTSVNEFN